MECAGSLTPELEGASHTCAHGDRIRKRNPTDHKKKGSVKP